MVAFTALPDGYAGWRNICHLPTACSPLTPWTHLRFAAIPFCARLLLAARCTRCLFYVVCRYMLQAPSRWFSFPESLRADVPVFDRYRPAPPMTLSAIRRWNSRRKQEEEVIMSITRPKKNICAGFILPYVRHWRRRTWLVMRKSGFSVSAAAGYQLLLADVSWRCTAAPALKTKAIC